MELAKRSGFFVGRNSAPKPFAVHQVFGLCFRHADFEFFVVHDYALIVQECLTPPAAPGRVGYRFQLWAIYPSAYSLCKPLLLNIGLLGLFGSRFQMRFHSFFSQHCLAWGGCFGRRFHAHGDKKSIPKGSSTLWKSKSYDNPHHMKASLWVGVALAFHYLDFLSE